MLCSTPEYLEATIRRQAEPSLLVGQTNTRTRRRPVEKEASAYPTIEWAALAGVAASVVAARFRHKAIDVVVTPANQNFHVSSLLWYNGYADPGASLTAYDQTHFRMVLNSEGIKLRRPVKYMSSMGG